MYFALERTHSALHLLSLEKINSTYRIAHYDTRELSHPSRLLGEGALIQCLQEMQSACITPMRALTMGVNDKDVIIRHLRLPAFHSLCKAYQYCAAKLSEEFPQFLQTYSWDARLLCAHSAQAPVMLCVAYPLEKIIFLQQVLAVCQLSLHRVEPSVCALARASLALLKLPEALFLLYEQPHFVLLWVQQGELWGCWSFKTWVEVQQQLSQPPFSEKELIVHEQVPQPINLKSRAFDLTHYVQSTMPMHWQAPGLTWLPALGLALHEGLV